MSTLNIHDENKEDQMLRRRGYNYYEVFQKMVNYACEAAEMLRGIIDNYKADTLSRKIVDMHKIEHTDDL